MTHITINGHRVFVEAGTRLSAALAELGYPLEHPCGGRGVCRKCTVLSDGAPVLACQYIIRGEENITLDPPAEVEAAAITPDAPRAATASLPARTDLVLDIGTTTLALALVDPASGTVLQVVTADNPQRAYGADVMSRIAYAAAHGVSPLTEPLRAEINAMIQKTGASFCEHLYIVGNTTMLHLFWGIDPSPMGTAPYTPAFLAERRVPAADCGIRGVREVISLPCFAPFAGADIVAGLYEVSHIGVDVSYRLLVDLGTNAEIVLYNKDNILCTSAAAGPCFEGASISAGMSAAAGAICAWDPDGTYETVKKAPPRGLCGTGLIDAVAGLLERGVITPEGHMPAGRFYLAEGVALTAADVREFQTAKAAIRAAISALLTRAGLKEEYVAAVFIAGGFAAALRPDRAVRAGLLPPAWRDRCIAVGNSSLRGTARYACNPASLRTYTDIARYIDLACDPAFSKDFIQFMDFD